MIHWIAIIILLAGCIQDGRQEDRPDPTRLDFQRDYNQSILSLWEGMMNRTYRFQASESLMNKSTYVDAIVLNNSYNIKLDLFGEGGLVYYAYKSNNQSRYCVVLMDRFLNCTDSEIVFKIGLKDYGSESVFAYIFNSSVIDAEKNYINNLVNSQNVSITRVENGYRISFRLSDLKIEELKALGFSISDIMRVDSVEIYIYFGNSGYRIDQYQYLVNGSVINKTSSVNISLNISDVGELNLDSDRYHQTMLKDLITLMNYYILIKGNYYTDETEIYKLAVATGVPEYCLYVSKRDICISYYVQMTNDRRACTLIGVSC